MRIFQLKACARMTRKAGITDLQLVEAVERLQQGACDADLGQSLFKQRVARQGQGRSGGFRMLVAFDKRERAIFLFGFAKSDQANLNDSEIEDAQALGKAWLALPGEKIRQALRDKQLIEVESDETPDA